MCFFPVWIPSIPLVWWWLALPFCWWEAGLEGWLSPCSVLTLMFRCCCWGLLWPWDIPQESSTVRAASCSAGAVWARGGKWKFKTWKLTGTCSRSLPVWLSGHILESLSCMFKYRFNRIPGKRNKRIMCKGLCCDVIHESPGGFCVCASLDVQIWASRY